MNTKAIRDSQAFILSQEQVKEKILWKSCWKLSKKHWKRILWLPQKVMGLKNRDGKIQWEWGKIISQAFCWHKRYVQQSHNDLKIYFKLSFNPRIFVVLEMDDSKPLRGWDIKCLIFIFEQHGHLQSYPLLCVFFCWSAQQFKLVGNSSRTVYQ